jgi:indolepyruvate decarboxylase
MSRSPGRRMKIGEFLLSRLKEAGVHHLFGVPGDYNLELLQQLQDTGALKWIGTGPERYRSGDADDRDLLAVGAADAVDRAERADAVRHQ